jgi:hypothetical protein
MPSDSLFAYLVTKFSTSTENLATEALAYILRRSEAASEAMVRFGQLYVRELAGPLQFETQDWDASDNAIPDIVGIDSRALRPLVIEAKFDAALTENQPNTYLERLPEGEPGLLLHVVPARRLEGVWGQVTARAQHRFGIRGETDVGAGRLAWVNDNHALGITSWSSLLTFLHAAVDATPGDDIGKELEQLEGLCARLDDEAFLPLRPEDLVGVHGRRLQNFLTIIERVCSLLFGEGVASANTPEGAPRGRSASAAGWIGRYLAISGWTCLLRVSASGWGQLADTPLWLQIGYQGVPSVPVARAALGEVLVDNPRRVFERASFVDVAIWLPTGVDLPDVIENVAAQIRRIASVLAQRVASA